MSCNCCCGHPRTKSHWQQESRSDRIGLATGTNDTKHARLTFRSSCLCIESAPYRDSQPAHPRGGRIAFHGRTFRPFLLPGKQIVLSAARKYFRSTLVHSHVLPTSGQVHYLATLALRRDETHVNDRSWYVPYGIMERTARMGLVADVLPMSPNVLVHCST